MYLILCAACFKNEVPDVNIRIITVNSQHCLDVKHRVPYKLFQLELITCQVLLTGNNIGPSCVLQLLFSEKTKNCL